MTRTTSTMLSSATSARRGALLLTAIVVLLGTLTVGSKDAWAQSANIEVRVIVGSNDGSGVDGALRSLRSQLRSRFGHHDSFRQVRVENVTLTSGATRPVSLPNGQTVNVTFQGMSGSSFRISVSMPGGGGTLTSPPGGVFFVAGPPYNGGTIIVAVRT